MDLPRKWFQLIMCCVSTRIKIVLGCLLTAVAIGWLYFDAGIKVESGVRSFITSNGTEYMFPCVITAPEAISSLRRTDNDTCKIEIGTVACKIAKGTLFPATIAHRCPTGKYVPNRSVGCFPFDSTKYTSYRELSADNTPKKCVDSCMRMGHRYAIVTNGNLCYCGNADPNLEQLQNAGKCNKPCSGNPALHCGAPLYVSVFETGFANHTMLPVRNEPKPEEKPARIAFLLMFYKRNIRQIRRLFGAIYDSRHYYYIHVDARQDYLHRELLELQKSFTNMHITTTRVGLSWGCDTFLQVILDCMREIVSIPTWEFDFIINMSESDFMIKSVAKLTSFLTANPGRNFLLDQKVLAPEAYLIGTGLNKNFIECAGRMWDLGRRTLPTGITYQGGSDWFGVTKEFARYATDTRDELVDDLRTVMKYSGFGTETYFHTVLYNSRFCQTRFDSSLRLVSWKKGSGCSPSQTIDWTGCSPVALRKDDWTMIMAKETDDIFMARKFNPAFDQTIILLFEERMYGKYPPHTPNLNSYWENVYHHGDLESTQRKSAALVNVAFALSNAYGHESLLRYQGTVKVLEVTHYFTRNTFHSFLVRYVASVGNETVELELSVKPRNLFRRYESTLPDFDRRPLELYVTNKLDRAERLPVDFDRVLSVAQTPSLVIVLIPENKLEQPRTHAVRVEWISPAQRDVVAVDNFSVVEVAGKSANHAFKSSLEPPLAAGVWKARIAFNETLVGTVEFFVTSDEMIFQQQHHAKCDRISLRDLIGGYSSTLQDEPFQTLPRTLAAWKQIFMIPNVCIVRGKGVVEHSVGSGTIEKCSDTLWSSLAPDPKSDLPYLLKRNRSK